LISAVAGPLDALKAEVTLSWGPAAVIREEKRLREEKRVRAVPAQ
jgi:hypothetical protein